MNRPLLTLIALCASIGLVAQAAVIDPSLSAEEQGRAIAIEANRRDQGFAGSNPFPGGYRNDRAITLCLARHL